MIYEGIQKWCWRNPRKRYHLIFHTSACNFAIEDLKKLFDLDLPWYLPKNVYYEIKELSHYRNEKQFFNLWKEKGRKVLKSNLEDFYGEQTNLGGFSETKTEPLIFVFGSKLKLQEFLECTETKSNYYVYFHTHDQVEIGQMEDPSAVVVPIGEAKKNLSFLNRLESFNLVHTKKDEKIPARRMKGKELTGKKDQCKYVVGERYESGGESCIYEHAKDRGQLLKIFKYEISTEKEMKLQMLMLTRKVAPYMEVPLDILEYENRKVGILLRKVEGKTLKDVYLEDDLTIREKLRIMQKVLRGLLEMNMYDAICVDLALQNIMLDQEGKVVFVDTDSFQIMDYSSESLGRMEYQHPKYVRSQKEGKRSWYEPLYQNFAFSVLLFKFLVTGTRNPLSQNGTEELGEELIWGGDFSFPYTVEEMKLGVVNEACMWNWELLPEKLKEAFVSIFQFQREASLGYWIKVLDDVLKGEEK